MRLLFLACFFSLAAFFLFPTALYSQDQVTEGEAQGALAELSPTRFLPDHPLYFLITVKENVERFFRPSAKEKAEFDFILAGKRLVETERLADKGKKQKAEENLLRYFQRIDIQIREIEKAKAQSQDTGSMLGEMLEDFPYHITLIALLEERDLSNTKLSKAALVKLIEVLGTIRPDAEDLFPSLRDASPSPSPPLPTPADNESSPGFRPKRIIY